MPIDVYQQVTDQIIVALEAGTVPWRNPILGHEGAGWPRNLASDKAYRGSNVFLLALTAWSQGYSSPYWLTFRQVKIKGGSVRKGEHSTLVVFWKQLTVEDEETGKPKRVHVLRHYRVFNTEQCEGLDVPVTEVPKPPLETFQRIEEAQHIVDGYAGPEVHHKGVRACYRPLLDEVLIPEPMRFESPETYYATLFHELAHSTGHSSRLDRGLDTTLTPFGSPDYSREELVAEMTAAFLCGHAGIAPAMIENTASYIADWLKRLKDDKKMVIHAAGKAQRAADYILGVEYTNEEGQSEAQ